MICPLYEGEDDFAWMYRGMEGTERMRKNTRARRQRERERQAPKPATPLIFGPGEPREPTTKGVPKPPPMPKSVQV